jgi:flagellar biosynthesis protein FlhF
MRIKRIEADSIAEAMRELRRELGDHALILHTRQLAPRGVAGWFRSPRVEILGAVDEPHLMSAGSAPAPAAANSPPSAFARMQSAAQAAVQVALGMPQAPAPPAVPEPAVPPRSKKGRKASRGGATPEPQREAVAARLAKCRAANPSVPIAREAAPALAGRRDGEAGGVALAEADPARSLAGIAFGTTEWTRVGRRARRIAFVGPTGAGKTTTLAKLAARAQLEHGRRIGLVTIDTYRIGAVPQLGAYADILQVPLEVAHTPEELSHALARLNNRDIVFIDTIGRSPLGGGVDGLVPFLATAAADEVHLVLSAPTRPSDSIRAARSFARLVPNRLVVTKIDETDDHSSVAVVARATGLPLTWLGTGQEVPDDIEEATPARIGALAAVDGAAR